MRTETNILCSIGAGLHPSRLDERHRMGHMWLRWKDELSGQTVTRGYWPELSEVPPGVDEREYLCNYAVPGYYKADSSESDLIEADKRFRLASWDLPEASRDKLSTWWCFLPVNQKWCPSGQYSCNEKIPDTHNCCSWAVAGLRFAAEDNKIVVCERTKRLKHVELAIWGNDEF